MQVHFATHTYYPNRKNQRWWVTSCKRKFMTKDKWSKPDFVTDYIQNVTCPICLENSGLELLDLVP